MRNADDVLNLITAFMENNPLNRAAELENLIIFDAPVVGVASAGDPLFVKLKDPEVVAPHHMAPEEWLPGAKSVISWFIPFSSRVRESNYGAIDQPSTEWMYGRYEGEIFNNSVRTFLVNELIHRGAGAVAPAQDPRFKVIELASSWSERHAAYIAGLGTFNLSKSFITPKGCAGRFGSVITDWELAPTERSVTGLYDYCNSCGKCISRCPVYAIAPEGKSHNPCRIYCDDILEKYKPRYGCGKCQTNVPCEAGIPEGIRMG